MHYQNVVGLFFDSTWAIQPETMPRLVQVVNRWSIGAKMDKEMVAEMMAARQRKLEAVQGGVAVLPLFGVIAQRMNMMQEVSEGGTSTEMFGAAFDKAIASPDVGAVVLNIDSPGGSVYGVQELADKIHAARGSKPIVAVANSLAASAAYWIGAAADKFYVTPSGEVGSIGVFTMHTDWSQFNEKMGVTPTYISAGKYKIEGHSDAPLDSEARVAIQAGVDSYYATFTESVARSRGVSVREVRNGFGEGRVVRATKAVEEGMADGVKTFEQVIGELTRNQTAKPKRSASGYLEKRELQQRYGGE